ncbi:unnamed protein product [Prunus armeniaca]|uniref:Uncharacterized protein n=1 Tax=Prunus armeniaca TaxID=36596 RepID=A0A6J5VD34_PRUAR|nr:unnamed protein product [Prunus armeniaca]
MLDTIKLFGLLPSPFTYTIMDANIERGNIHGMLELLQEMEANAIEPTHVSYTVVIKGLIKLGKLQEAVHLVEEMYAKGITPDQITYNTLIKCFCKARDFKKAFQLHNEMLIHNLEPTPVTYNVLINGLCVYGDLMDADRLLVSLCDCNINLTKVAYTTLIKAHCAKDDVHRAVGLFHQMVEKGFEISIRGYSAVINRLCKREETDPENPIRHGTQITLYLRPDDKYEFSDPPQIQGLLKNYLQFVSFPNLYMEIKNQGLLSELLDPVAYTHFTTEGEVEFRSVLYIPGMGPLNNKDVVNAKTKNICLYVKRIFISDDFDGEVVRIMRKQLIRKTFDMIQEISESENREDYKNLWENFGSLDDYVENMPENQNAIYYLAADSLKSARFLEKLVQKDIEGSVLPTLVVVQ